MQKFVKSCNDLSTMEIQRIIELLSQIWAPEKPDSTEKQYLQMIEHKRQSCSLPFHRYILVSNKDDLFGLGIMTYREVIAEERRIRNLALSGVCVKEDARGQSIGFDIVKTAFEYVDNNDFDCSIFQTKVPDFYLKLGCRTINNQFTNSKSSDLSKNPWWEPYTMIYPKDFNMGSNLIDLNGEGY